NAATEAAARSEAAIAWHFSRASMVSSGVGFVEPFAFELSLISRRNTRRHAGLAEPIICSSIADTASDRTAPGRNRLPRRAARPQQALFLSRVPARMHMPSQLTTVPGAADRETILDRARSMLATLRKQALAAERNRLIPRETHKNFQDAGFYRLFQPARYGGFLKPINKKIEGGAEVWKGCGAPAWVFHKLSGAKTNFCLP